MTTTKTLLVGAAIGALLAIGAVAVAVPTLNSPSAKEVATQMAEQSNGANGGNPLDPPNFYGTR